MEFQEIGKYGAEVLIAFILFKIVDTLTKRKNSNNNVHIIEILNKQIIIMEQQKDILSHIKEINTKNGERLESMNTNMSVAMDRQTTMMKHLENISQMIVEQNR